MSELIRQGGTFNPSRESAGSKASTRKSVSAEPSQKAAGWLLAIPLAATALQFVAYWIPELLALPPVTFVVVQLSPLASPNIASSGVAVTAAQSGLSASLTVILLFAALVAHHAARSSLAPVHLLTAPAAAVAGLAALGQLVLVVPGGTEVIGGLALLAVEAGLAVQAVRTVLGVDPSAAGMPRGPGGGAVVLLGITVLPPLALGRALVGHDLRDAVATLPMPLALEFLPQPATALLWLSGMCVILVVWGLWHVLPPFADRKLVAPIAVLVLGLALGLGYAFGEASTSAAQLAALIANGG